MGVIHVNEVTMGTDKTLKTGSENGYEARVRRISRHIRHLGFALFGGGAFLMMVFLMASVVSGNRHGEVYDPFTHEKLQTDQPQPEQGEPQP